MVKWLIFSIDSNNFALELSEVESVIFALEIIASNHKNPPKLGVINFHGELISVFDLRSIFGFEEKELAVNDQFIIVKENSKCFALTVNKALEVVEFAKEDISPIPNQGSFNFCDFFIQFDDKLFPILNIKNLQKSYQI